MKLNFRLESWAAIAPGLESSEDWKRWLQHPGAIDAPLGEIPLTGIPAMLRRRFNTLGKCVMGASLPLVEGAGLIPSVFASRHGETELSFALLEGIARHEPMSPTRFSLGVHNAISGLYSIVRKDTSAVTAIAAMEGLVLQALFETLGQLQSSDRVLCVICEMPLAEFYSKHTTAEDVPVPYAIAMVLGNENGAPYCLEQTGPGTPEEPSQQGRLHADVLGLLRLLSGMSGVIVFPGPQASWRVAKVEV